MATSVEASGRYTELLQQIASLQENLSNATAVCHALKDQNETLVQSHERLRSENSHLVEALRDAKQNYTRIQQVKAENDKKQDNILRDLRAQYEKQSVDYATMQADLARRGPQDLQIIRMKILEDLSSKFRGKVSKAEQEAEKYKDLYYKHKRAHDLLSDEKDQLVESHQRRINGMDRAHKAAIDQISQSMQQLQARARVSYQMLFTPARLIIRLVHIIIVLNWIMWCMYQDASAPVSGQVPTLQRKLAAADVARRELTQEIQDLRKEKEDIVVAMNSSSLLSARQIAELKSELLKVQCEREQSQSKHEAKEASINALQKRLEETRLRLSDTEQKLQSLQVLCDQVTKENTHLKDDHAARLLQLEAQYEQRVRALDAKLKEEKTAGERVLTQKAKEIEELNRTVERQRHDQERAMQSLNARMQQLQQNKTATERQLRETQRELDTVNENGRKILEAAHAKLDSQAETVQKLSKHTRDLESTLKDKDMEITNLQSQMGQSDTARKNADNDLAKIKMELQSVCDTCCSFLDDDWI